MLLHLEGFLSYGKHGFSLARNPSNFLSSKVLQDILRLLVSIIAADRGSVKEADLPGNGVLI